jgi:hypothetical protein
MGSAKQFAHHIHYLRDNERFDIARCRKRAASLLVKLDRLITGSILRSKLVFLINVRPHAAFIEGARFWVSILWISIRWISILEQVCGYILPSVWTLIMRAIKCLKGVRWMPWR